jgi:hypothetical protein
MKESKQIIMLTYLRMKDAMRKSKVTLQGAEVI